MSLQGQLVVVTGAGGFIGSNIARELAAAGADVVVCDSFQHEDSWRYIASSLLHDVLLAEELFPWLERNAGHVAAIVHMGAISATTERDLPRIISNNIRLTLDLWDYAATHGATYIYASSAATYGDGSAGFVDDDTPAALAALRPLNPYGWSKHVVDRRIVDGVNRQQPAPPRWAGLKFFNVYGPNEGHKGPMRSVVHQMYPLAAAGEPVRLFKSEHPEFEDGGQLRDFVYVKDCAAVVCNMLRSDRLSGIYNIGTGRARSFADLARAVFAALDSDPRIEYVDMPSQLIGRYQYYTQADMAKLARRGLAPRFHSLEEGVRDYVLGHLVDELEPAAP